MTIKDLHDKYDEVDHLLFDEEHIDTTLDELDHIDEHLRKYASEVLRHAKKK